jgi:hypothetical protein
MSFGGVGAEEVSLTGSSFVDVSHLRYLNGHVFSNQMEWLSVVAVCFWGLTAVMSHFALVLGVLEGGRRN